jgi:glycosidase
MKSKIVRIFFVSLCLLFSSITNFSAANDNNVEWNGLYHDSFNNFYRSPFGAVPTGTTVNLKFRSFRFDLTSVTLRVYVLDPVTNITVGPTDYAFSYSSNDGVYDYWQVNFTAPSNPRLAYYKIRATDGTSNAWYSDAYNGDHDNLGQGGDGTVTTYKADFSTPTWLHNSAVYQIFPDRFRNGDITNDWCRSGNTTGCPSLYSSAPSNNIIHTTWNEAMRDPRQAPINNNAFGSQFYGGDLKGVEDKLDYIKGLGFDTIYFTPIFAGRSNHGYDADNFHQIAPQLGGDAAFQSLVTAANQRGMKIIADGVWNHVSQDSLYMDFYGRYASDGGCESFSSPYRNWFTWNATATSVPCLWTHYNGWFGFGGLPELTENAQVRDFFYRTPSTNVTQYWLDRGVSGWRFDVADNISHDWWADYRGYAKTYNANAPLIGEVWQDASSFLIGNQLDSVMNYRFRKNTLGFARGVDWSDNDNQGGERIIGLVPSQFNRAMLAIREDYPLPAQLAMLNLIDSHDTNRALYALSILGESQAQAKDRLKLAAIFQFTYIGSPMVYYGDEAGINSPSMANSPNGQPEDDPYNRAPYPWADETGDTNVYGPADSSLISFYTTLGSIRRSNVALRTGTFQELLMGDITPSTTDNNTYAFIRESGANKVLVAMNNGTTANTVTIPVGSYFADGTILNEQLNTATNAVFTVSGGNVTFTLPARSGAILSPQVPTLASASISGRIAFSNGAGARRVNVVLQNMSGGQSFKTKTDGDGNFTFEQIPTGSTYTITPSLFYHNFAPNNQAVALTENVNGLTFTAQRSQ